jgi:hypothetical protein
MKQSESGFSVLKLLFWMAILAALVSNGFQLLQIYQTSWKVQDVFESVSRNMVNSSEDAIRKKLPVLFKVAYISHDDVPEEFYDNILIQSTAGRVEISSFYTETLWPLGPVENVDEEGTYDPQELTGLDYLRDKIRQDLYFEPYAETP